MGQLESFEDLELSERILVCYAVLLDGQEAFQYLETSRGSAERLLSAARALSELEPSLRMVLVGSLLRRSIEAYDGN